MSEEDLTSTSICARSSRCCKGLISDSTFANFYLAKFATACASLTPSRSHQQILAMSSHKARQTMAADTG